MPKRSRLNDDDDSAVMAPSSGLDALFNREVLLTPGRERMLAKIYLETGDAEARRELIEANYRLVGNRARYYRRQAGTTFELDDLIVMGTVGLVRAVEKFDYRRGFRLSTYAVWWINREIQRTLYNESRLIRLPIHISNKLRRFSVEVSFLRQTLSREPTVEDIEGHLGYTEKQVAEMTALSDAIESLDVTTGEKDTLSKYDVIGDDPFQDLHEMENRQELIDRLLVVLPERERKAIELRFGLVDGHHRTLVEVAQIMKITRERLRQLEGNALKRLRNYHRGI